MRAVITTGERQMEVVDTPPPGEPGRGEVIVRPGAVGICGSDFHFLLDELRPGDGSPFPRIQGHEVAATVEAVGPDCDRGLAPGDTVALHPLSHCTENEFGDAVRFVENHAGRLENLITHHFPLERAPEALQWAMDHQAEAMKVVIGEGG